MNDVQTTNTNTQVFLPNGKDIGITKSGQLPLTQNLTNDAKRAYILPNLAHTSLLSVGQLCDDNCWAIFHKTHMFIIKNNQIILQGNRNLLDGLWDVMLQNTTKLKQFDQTKNLLNVIVYKSKTNFELANFYMRVLVVQRSKHFKMQLIKISFPHGQALKNLKCTNTFEIRPI